PPTARTAKLPSRPNRPAKYCRASPASSSRYPRLPAQRSMADFSTDMVVAAIGPRPYRPLVDRFHETNQIGRAEFRPDGPHPEERASLARVSKDGRWHDLACGRPSRRANRNRLLPISTPLKCRSRAGPTSVRAPLDEVDVDMIRTSETMYCSD